MFQIIGAMAEFERALIQERVRAGLRHARAQGKRLGRPGVNVEVKRIRELRAHGASLRTIARQLGVSGWGRFIGHSQRVPKPYPRPV